MMKKLMSVVIAVLLIMCVACPAFAAGSNDSPVDMAAKGPDGETVDIEVSAATETFDIPVEDGGTVDFGDGEEVAAETLTVVYQQDLHVDPEDLPVTITFEVPAAGKNDVLHVMHYTNGAWVQVAQATGTTVTATFTDLSPVAIVLEKKASSGYEPPKDTPSSITGPIYGGTGSSSSSSGTTTTSPQTGADMTVLYVSAAVMLLAGAVAFAAKKHVKD